MVVLRGGAVSYERGTPVALSRRPCSDTASVGMSLSGSIIDSCITQLEAQGPSRTCNESKEEEEGVTVPRRPQTQAPKSTQLGGLSLSHTHTHQSLSLANTHTPAYLSLSLSLSLSLTVPSRPPTPAPKSAQLAGLGRPVLRRCSES